MYLWSGETTVKSAADTTGVSQKTIVQLYQYMRDDPGTDHSIKRTRTDDTEKKDTMEELARSQPMEVKTIDNMRLSLLAIEVYERL
jgi:hypothetical protein